MLQIVCLFATIRAMRNFTTHKLGFVLLLIFSSAYAFGDDLGWAVGGDGNQLITALQTCCADVG
jgi:hypothetical protein